MNVLTSSLIVGNCFCVFCNMFNCEVFFGITVQFYEYNMIFFLLEVSVKYVYESILKMFCVF